MAFQFTCPNGHLLSADEMQAGQQCQCPQCGVVCVIPSPAGDASGGFAPNPFSFGQEFGSFPTPAPPQTPAPPAPSTAPAALPDDLLSELPELAAGPSLPPGAGGFGGPSSFGGAATFSTPLPALLHIPCPNGHELETPHEMLGQHVMCPFCQAQFVLALDKSIEFIQRREAEQEARDERRGKLWIRWAIAFAVLVLGGLLALIAQSNK